MSGAYDPGPRKPWAVTSIRVLLVAVAGLFIVRFGLLGIVLGGEYITGGATVTPQLDSETRFLSALAVGVAVVWMFRDFQRLPKAVALLSLLSLLGGIMRVVSIAQFGVPGTTAVAATATELAVPTTMLWLLRQRA